MKKRVALSWSSGKDSAWVLERLREDPALEVAALIVSLNGEFQRVAMHGVRRELVEEQARLAGLPLWVVELPWPCTNEQYETRMKAAWQQAISQGVTAIAFGDLFLEDIRAYREKQLADTGLELLFPAWGIPTGELAQRMIAEGFRAVVTCVDPKQLDGSFAGRRFDATFVADLPAGVDPCGEHGEFHTFVTHSPGFRGSVEVLSGEIVDRGEFRYADFTFPPHCEPGFTGDRFF